LADLALLGQIDCHVESFRLAASGSEAQESGHSGKA
jgi:hypothetical protein